MLADFELLERLVGFDTTSRNSNLPMADFICEYADKTARIERQPSPDGAKANLILAVGPEGADRNGLVLSGHMDVVPAEEPEWRSDPFELHDEGERLFARGSCDMKGFLAVALNVALEARDLKAPLVLVFTYDEEVGTIGARHLVEHWEDARVLPRSAIIGEPTSMRVVRLHKGHLKIKVDLRGQSAHSGYPHLGKNAIDAAARVLVSLRGLRHKLESAGGPNSDYFPEVPFVPLCIGTIHGGSAVNVVPDRCVIEVGARPLPGMNSAGIVASIREAVANAAGDAPFRFDVTGESPPMLLERDTPIYRELCELTGQVDDCSVSFATDAGWFTRAGMDCAICGPGSIEVAHKPNEFVPKQQLVDARALLKQSVERFCL